MAAMFMIAIEADDRLDGHAADRGPARRPAPLRLGVLVLSADTDRDHGGVRQAGRPLRTTAGAVAGIAVFLAGSLLCGAAWSMQSLIGFRLVQGIGAGAIQRVGSPSWATSIRCTSVAGFQGYLASVWGISSVLGPLAGGLIVRHFGWPWIFWINVPVGILAAAGFLAFRGWTWRA